jgi:predicted CXXCH cytochrome family protein
MVQTFITSLRILLLATLLGSLPFTVASAAEETASSFGNIAIPTPVKPAAAANCVEPVEVMRRDHMKFLLHQRDATVLEGERDKKYSLVGCMDCHNPASANGEIVRYEDAEHFCASCHNYASVNIDCFECHADRGLASSQQSSLPLWNDTQQLSMQTFRHQMEPLHGD